MKKIITALLLVSYAFSIEQIDPTVSNFGINQPLQDEVVVDENSINDLDSIQNVFFYHKNVEKKKTIQHLEYSKDTTFYIRTRLAMNSFIVFPPDEEITGFSIGDDNFQVEVIDGVGVKNSIKIKPIKYTYVDTNLVAIGKSGRVYNFYIWSTKYTHRFVPHLTTYITLKKLDLKTEDKERLNQAKIAVLQKENSILLQEIDALTTKAKTVKELEDEVFRVDINALDFSFKIKNDSDKRLEAVFRTENRTYVVLKTNLIPQFINDFGEDISYFKRGKVVALDHIKNFTVQYDDQTIEIKKIGQYKQKKDKTIEHIVKLEELEFGYRAKTRFSHSKWKTLFKPFTEKHPDVQKFIPEIVFNDNDFTYFKFNIERADKTLPLIYKVADEKDTLINHTVINDYLRVEIINNKFTLRVGEKHLCVDKTK